MHRGGPRRFSSLPDERQADFSGWPGTRVAGPAEAKMKPPAGPFDQIEGSGIVGTALRRQSDR